MGRASASWIAVAVLAVVVAIIVFVPLAVPPQELEPDRSLRATAHEAFARRLQFGTQIVYTYGPWGILQRGDADQRTRRVSLGVSLLMALAFAYALVSMAREAKAGPATAAAIIVAAGALCLAGGNDARFVAAEILLLLWCLAMPRGRRHLPLVALVALIALIKLSYLAGALLVMAFVAAIRRRVGDVAVFLLALAAGWIAAGQQLGNVPAFLGRGAAIVAGYGGAAGLSHGLTADLISAVIGAAGLIVLAIFVERDAVRVAAVAAVVFLVLKLGFVRQDDAHVRGAAALLSFFGLGYALLRIDHPRLARARRTVSIAAGALLAVVIAVDGPLLLDAAKSAVAAPRRPSAPRVDALPNVRGPIDAYPWGSAHLIARGAQYAPRPVFQSYMAWTPSLAELNAQSLRGPGAPSWLWIEIVAIDGHPPLLDDGPSWPEIIARYDIDRRVDYRLLARKRSVAERIVSIPVATIRAPFDAPIALPQVGDDLLWCAIDVSPRLVTRVAGFLLRPPRLTLRTSTADGGTTTYTVPVAAAGGGFVLSPEVDSVGTFEALVRSRKAGAVPGRRVTEIRVGSESVLTHSFGSELTLRVARLRFTTPP